MALPAPNNKRSSNSLSRLIWEILAAAIVAIAFLFMSTKNQERENNLISALNTHEKDENYLRMMVDDLKQKYETIKAENKELESDNNELLDKMNLANIKYESLQSQLNQQQSKADPAPPHSPMTAITQTSSLDNFNQPLEGVAIVCCLDGPGWLQNRYSMSVMNMMEALPKNWKVQLFHKGSVQSFKGITRNPGILVLFLT
jgi:hypothetical protein